MADKVEHSLCDEHLDFEDSSNDTVEIKTAAEDALMKAAQDRIREMEEEVEKLKQLQNDVNKQLNKDSPSGLKSLEEIIEVDKRSVYIGNVDYGATAEELEQHFYGCGPINRVTILSNKYDGHPKGFAYIEFKEKDSVRTAMAMDESIFRERPLKVMPKRTNQPGLSTTHRPPRGVGAFRGSRGLRRSFLSPYQWRPMRGPREARRGFYGPY